MNEFQTWQPAGDPVRYLELMDYERLNRALYDATMPPAPYQVSRRVIRNLNAPKLPVVNRRRLGAVK